MTPGHTFVVEQLGLALAGAEHRIEELQAENAELRRQLSAVVPRPEPT